MEIDKKKKYESVNNAYLSGILRKNKKEKGLDESLVWLLQLVLLCLPYLLYKFITEEPNSFAQLKHSIEPIELLYILTLYSFMLLISSIHLRIRRLQRQEREHLSKKKEEQIYLQYLPYSIWRQFSGNKRFFFAPFVFLILAISFSYR